MLGRRAADARVADEYDARIDAMACHDQHEREAVTIELPLDEKRALNGMAPESMLPFGEQPSAIEAEFATAPAEATEADHQPRSDLGAGRRCLRRGPFEGSKWVNQAVECRR